MNITFEYGHCFDFGAYASANAAIALQCIILELVTVFTALLDDSEAPRPVKLASKKPSDNLAIESENHLEIRILYFNRL